MSISRGGRTFFVLAFGIGGAAVLAAMFAGGGERWANAAFVFGLPWSLLFTQLGLVSAKTAPQSGWLLVLAVGVNTGILWGWRSARKA